MESIMAVAHVHLPHPHIPHVGSPQDQAHLEGTRPSRTGGIILGIGMCVALLAWATALIAILSIGPSEAGAVTPRNALLTAVAIASAISLFLMGIWKAYRA